MKTTIKTTSKNGTTTEAEVPPAAVLDALGVPVDPNASARKNPPLYPNLGKNPARVPDKIAVFRVDPPDGYLGCFPADTDEEGLKRLVGGYVLDLRLRDVEGKEMPGGRMMLSIKAPPIDPEVVRRQTANGTNKDSTLDAIARNIDPLKQLFEIQNQQQRAFQTQTESELQRLKEERKAEQEERKREREADILRMKEEARIRQEELDARHAREVAMLEARAKADREREEQRGRERSEEAQRQRQADKEQWMQWATMMNQAAGKQNELMIAAMTNSKTDLTAFTSMFDKALAVAQAGREEDPDVKAFEVMGKGLENLTELMRGTSTTEKAAVKRILEKLPEEKRNAVLAALTGKAPDKQLEAKNGQSKKKNGASSNGASDGDGEGGDKKSRVEKKLAKLAATLAEKGYDLEDVLEDSIEQAEALEHARDEGDEDDEEEEDEDERASRRDRRDSGVQNRARANGSNGHGKSGNGATASAGDRARTPVAGHDRQDAPRTSDPSVAERAEDDGRSEASGGGGEGGPGVAGGKPST